LLLVVYIYIKEKLQLTLSTTLRCLAISFSGRTAINRTTADFGGNARLPIGRNKWLFSTCRGRDTIIGGWQTTGLLTYTSGDYHALAI